MESLLLDERKNERAKYNTLYAKSKQKSLIQAFPSGAQVMAA